MFVGFGADLVERLLGVGVVGVDDGGGLGHQVGASGEADGDEALLPLRDPERLSDRAGPGGGAPRGGRFDLKTWHCWQHISEDVAFPVDCIVAVLALPRGIDAGLCSEAQLAPYIRLCTVEGARGSKLLRKDLLELAAKVPPDQAAPLYLVLPEAKRTRLFEARRARPS